MGNLCTSVFQNTRAWNGKTEIRQKNSYEEGKMRVVSMESKLGTEKKEVAVPITT